MRDVSTALRAPTHRRPGGIDKIDRLLRRANARIFLGLCPKPRSLSHGCLQQSWSFRANPVNRIRSTLPHGRIALSTSNQRFCDTAKTASISPHLLEAPMRKTSGVRGRSPCDWVRTGEHNPRSPHATANRAPLFIHLTRFQHRRPECEPRPKRAQSDPPPAPAARELTGQRQRNRARRCVPVQPHVIAHPPRLAPRPRPHGFDNSPIRLMRNDQIQIAGRISQLPVSLNALHMRPRIANMRTHLPSRRLPRGVAKQRVEELHRRDAARDIRDLSR